MEEFIYKFSFTLQLNGFDITSKSHLNHDIKDKIKINKFANLSTGQSSSHEIQCLEVCLLIIY
jgi:hypothetical protein